MEHQGIIFENSVLWWYRVKLSRSDECMIADSLDYMDYTLYILYGLYKMVIAEDWPNSALLKLIMPVKF